MIVLMQTGYYEQFPVDIDESQPLVEGADLMEWEGEKYWGIEIRRDEFLDFLEEHTPEGCQAAVTIGGKGVVKTMLDFSGKEIPKGCKGFVSIKGKEIVRVMFLCSIV